MLVLLTLALALGGCEQDERERPSVVLVSIDGLRADRVGPATTPALAGLIDAGTSFPRTWSHTPLTLPSHVSILTGLLPHLHGIRDERGYPFDGDRFPWLPSRLQGEGYVTAGFVSSWPLSNLDGLEVGFDEWNDLGPGAPRPRRAAEETLKAVREWWAGLSPQATSFLFVQLSDPNPPWDERGYEDRVREADRALAGILDLVRTRPDTLVVVTADHGEGLPEDGEVGHGVLLTPEVLRVPLVFAGGPVEVGQRRDDPAALVDIVPTISGLLGLEAPLKQSGRDLFEPGTEAGQIYAETWFPRIRLGWSELRALVDGDRQLVVGARAELRVLEGPEEGASEEEERRRYVALRREISRYDRGFRPPEPLPDDERERLARYGFHGSSTPVTDAERPDPRDRLGSLRALRRAWDLYREEDLEAAIPAFEEVLAENPWMLDVREARATALLRSGRHDEAAEAYRETLRVSGGDGRYAALAAKAYLEAGELDEALDLAHYVLESATVADPPQEILVRASEALIDAGRSGEAVGLLEPLAGDDRPAIVAALVGAMVAASDLPGAMTVLHRLEELRPDEARTHEVAALVAWKTERADEAEARLRRALALDPSRGDAWELLGDVLDRLGKSEEALRAWERAVELDPRAWEVRWRLGMRAAELGRERLARDALEKVVKEAPEPRFHGEKVAAEKVLRSLEGGT